MNYKFCILSAGKGTRNNSIDGLHKSLLPIENKAIISHIIDKVPLNIEIVITIGYKSDQIKSFINKVHFDRKIIFVDIENYDKSGSGPGFSLLCCKDRLQCPFIFTCSDTLTDEDYDFGEINYNWIGISKINKEESNRYLLIEGDEYLNRLYYGKGDKAFIGMAGIYDYERFWNNLNNNFLLKGEHQVWNGFSDLNKITLDKVKLKYFSWYDTGTEELYKRLKDKFSFEIVAPKNNECIYIQSGFVIKYFNDFNKTEKIINRIKFLGTTIPNVIKINNNMISYKYEDGETIASIYDNQILKKLMPFWYKNFGKSIFTKNEIFLDNCKKMYFEKTKERCAYFSNTEIDNIKYINGLEVVKINELLNNVDFESIYNKSIPSLFHGDFQPENILFNYKKNEFVLLDWRISFGNSLEIGDSYYDLSKLYHGLLINGNDVNNKLYKIKINDNSSIISYYSRNNLLFLANELEIFCKLNGYSWDNVKIVTSLIILSMSGLYNSFHNGEFDKFLFLLGKYLLTKSI